MTAAALFRERFGAAPAVLLRAHGRVNLIGEHIDYNGGLVLPAPIAPAVEVAVAPGAAGAVRIVSGKFGDAGLRDLSEGARGDWSDCAFGAARKAFELGAPRQGLLVALAGDLPEGAGLSSSAATIVGVIRAMLTLGGVERDGVALARAAQAVENDFMGVPSGLMDQMAIALALPGEALALDTQALDYERIRLPGNWRFAVFHSGETRVLSDGRYALRRAECEAAARAIGAPHLCRADAAALARIGSLEDPLRRRARHAVSEHRRTVEAVAALKAGDAPAFGRLMNESHRSLCEDFEATTPRIDEMAAASRAAGALGARMTGGGFGGCVVSLLPAELEERWAAGLARRFPGLAFVA